MKSKFLKVVSLLLVVVTLVSTLISITACKKKPQPENDKWEISDADYESMNIADVSASAHDGNRYVTLTATDSLFKSDIATDDIKVVAYHTNKANIESVDEDKIEENADNIFTETTITDVNIYANDQVSLMFSFKEPEYDYMCSYFFYVHKNAVEKNVFTFAFDNVYLESSVTPEAKIMTELKNGQVNPTIQVKLVNAKAVSEIKTEDISLSGALEGMKVVSAVSTEDTITIETEGKVEISLAPYGYVQLSAPTNDQDVFVLAMTEIEQLNAYVNAETFALQEGLLHFDIDIIGAEYAVTEIELASHITLEGFEVESVQVFDDQDIMRLFVKCDADNVDNAIKSLFGKTLAIDGKAIGGDGISVEMNATCASLGGVIDSIDKVKGEDKYTATVELFARNGSMSELSAEDIVFGGDFEGAEITSIKNGVGYTATVEFTFSAKDKTAFNGSVTVPQSKLFDMWGSTSGNTSTEISYSLETSRKHTAIEQLLDKIGDISTKDFGKSISDVVSAFMESGITKFFSGDILGALGSLFADVTPSGREYEIHCMVTEMKVMMQNLDRDVKELKNSIQSYGDDILAAAQKNTLLALESKWNAFNTNYMERLERTVNSFNSACRRSIVDFVKSEHGDGLTLYYDGNGKLAIRDKSNPFYSVDAKVIDESKTVTIPLSDKSFTDCQAIFAKTGFKYSNELAVALMTDLGNAVKAMNEEGDMSIVYSTQMGEILYQYIYQQMMFNNLTSDFMDNLRADFVNLCKQITEGQKVLDSFYEMMKYKYNFQSEAIQDMENIRETLLVLLFNYGATASFVENYDSASTNNDMSTAIEKAINYIKNNEGLYAEPDGYSYCYAVGRPITLRISDMTYDMRIKCSIGNVSNEWANSVRAWRYDGYQDMGSRSGYYRAEYFRSNTGIARVDELLKKYEGYHTFDDLNADRVTMKSNNILSSKDLGLLKARFNSIKASGRFADYNDLSFGEYLTNGKVVKAPFEYMVHLIPEDQFSRRFYAIKPTRIATAGYKISDFPVDGSYTLVAYKEHLTDGMPTFSKYQMESLMIEAYRLHNGRYDTYEELSKLAEELAKLWYQGGGVTFIRGKEYAIGSGKASFDLDVNREYFHIHKEITQDIYDMKTDTMKNDYPVTQVALYGEHHALWTWDYGSYFRNNDYGEKYFIFPIG